VQSRRSALVVGFDPFLEWMPASLARELERECAALHGSAGQDGSGLEGAGQPRPLRQAELLQAAADAVVRWGEGLIEACGPHACAIKLQLACFEQLGGPGWEAARQVARAAQAAGLLVIADAKRGDVASTMQGYGRALFGPVPLPGGVAVAGLECDAATLHPYMGEDSLQALAPWLDAGRGVFVLVHTSNPSAGQLQGQRLADGTSVAERVAELVARWSARWRGRCGYGAVGAVVGATYPEAVRRLRARLPGVWMLLPGVGAQGGRLEDLPPAFDGAGLGAVVAVSRQILGAWRQAPEQDWRQACRQQARELREALEMIRHGR